MRASSMNQLKKTGDIAMMPPAEETRGLLDRVNHKGN
jgi:hypothetical protein